MAEATDSEYRLDPALVDKLMADIEASHAKAGTIPYWERQSPFKSLMFLTREEQRAYIEESFAPIDEFKLISENAWEIEKYAEYRFTTSEGRTFGVFFNGNQILGLLKIKGVSINHRDKAGVERIKKLAGFITEIDGDDDPMIYKTEVELANAWEQLHVFHGVPITKAEDEEYLDVILAGQPRFGIDPPDESDDDVDIDESEEPKPQR